LDTKTHPLLRRFFDNFPSLVSPESPEAS